MRQDLKDRFQLMALRELPRLRRFALHVCGDVHRADDYVQGTLERMYVAWPRVHEIDHPGAYLRAVLLRHVLNEGRRSWRREHCVALLPERGYDSTPGADLGMDLTRALAGLTTRQRAAVVLRYVEDRPVAEVARIMGTTPGTVKRQCSDGVARLRLILGDDFADEGLSLEEAGGGAR
ncbi:SigE family RNA polymerase sigma factor [Kineosporia rhizophila]|uniref:SigE family RNA polymerase sigma factor n=1 Tax=Kineosporia TaxID=49184 RepID=UPI001E426A6B|nr:MULTISPECIES: SigE family RNA polymerase sigma factor [Kineosporia]MCE0533931.1 SigE family RNA polymerase sigma factor [Kineosporia rhizophila]GLY13470.1 RNA polymerase sigma24 factor [Kineosporia sp. NBRC 101677]